MTGSRRRGVVLVGVALATAVSAPALATSGHDKHTKKAPHSIGPITTAWFDATRQTAAAPGLPQPGVGPHDLVIDGITVDSGQLPVAPPVTLPSPQRVAALAALRFRIPEGSSAGTLRLELAGTTTTKVDSKLPSGVSPVACPTTSRFKRGAQQPGPDAPTYTCTKRKAVGALSGDGKYVEFASIGRLVHGRALSFVILPGTIGVERLIFAKPGPTTLRLLSFDQPTPTPTDLPTLPPTKAPSSPGTSHHGGTSPGTGAGSGQTSTELPPIDTSSSGNGTGSVPQVAGSSAPQPVAQVSAAKPLDDTRARLAAIALLVGIVAAVAWLSVTDGTGRAVNAMRVASAVWAGEPVPRLPQQEWGFGRFRSHRDGPPPAI